MPRASRGGARQDRRFAASLPAGGGSTAMLATGQLLARRATSWSIRTVAGQQPRTVAMSVLPGLGLTQPTAAAAAPSTAPVRLRIEAGSEWRFEVNFLTTVKVQLSRGTAELFGTELALGQTYTFSAMKGAIYTWHGCELAVSQGEPVASLATGLSAASTTATGPGPGLGGCQVEYVAEETPMMEYANVHFGLETLREKAKQAGKEGPRVLILGPDDAGKTSLTKTLTAYATKRGRQPIVVNLDPSEGMLSVPPGGLTATAFRSMIDVEEGWGSSPISGPSPVPVKLPLVYFYGLRNPLDSDGAMYKPLVSRLAIAVASRLAEDADARTAGVIIDTPGAITAGKEASTDIIHHIISEFAITTILVLGSERLYSTIHRTYNMKPVPGSRQASSNEDGISVIKLTKSGGCVDRDENFMRPTREAQIRSYFFGRPVPSTAINTGSTAGTTLTLSPHAQQVDFNSLAIYNITVPDNEDEYDPAAFGVTNDSFLPGGSNEGPENSSDQAKSSRAEGQSSKTLNTNVLLARLPQASAEVPVPLALENTLLAVTNAEPDAPLAEIRDSSIVGFVYVADVDEKKGKVRILSPVGGRLPQKAMIWGRRWPGEAVGLLG